MNLVNDAWIPAIMQDGKSREVSLMEAFFDGESIRDLSVNPVQRVSLMRLLICIAQAALDGPEDEEDWLSCRSRIPAAAKQYLEKWHDRFELYGEHAFLQVPGLEVKEGKDKPLAALDCRSPHGGSATVLFDHSSHDLLNAPTDAENALNFLCFLNFSTSGKVGQSMWHGVQYSESTFAAPCIKYAHTLIRGATLESTIHMNLLTKTMVKRMPSGSWGQPVWEAFPEDISSTDAWKNAAETYVGRLVPLSRYVRLGVDADGARCITGPPHKSFKIQHLPAFREPSATVKMNVRDQTCYYMRLNPAKHIWRELGSVIAVLEETTGSGGAVALNQARLFGSQLATAETDIWVGGLALGSNEAKLGDMLEWSLGLDLMQFNEIPIRIYQQGVGLADTGEKVLRSGIAAYAKVLRSDAKGMKQTATTHFWSTLDAKHGVLLDAAAKLSDLNTDWYPVVRQAMEEAYRRSCPHKTPRQIQAYAQGLKKLRLKKLEGGNETTE